MHVQQMFDMFPLLWYLEGALLTAHAQRTELLVANISDTDKHWQTLSAVQCEDEKWAISTAVTFILNKNNTLKAVRTDGDMEQEFEDIDSEGRWQNLYLVSKAKTASMLMSHAIYI